FGVPIEPIDRTVDPVVEQREIKTYVYRLGLLPLYTLVVVIAGPQATGQFISTTDGIKGIIDRRRIPPHILERRDTLVAGNAITGTEFQVVHPGNRVHESLVRDAPCYTGRGKGTVAVFRAEI